MRIFGILGVINLVVTTIVYLETFECSKLNGKLTREQLAHIPKRLIREVTRHTVRSCGTIATVTSSGGKIISPNYPNSYDPLRLCYYHLTAEREGGIILHINELQIEALSNCRYDRLDIYAGSTTNDPLLRRLCGRIDNYEFTINASQVLLVFISDSSTQEKGFEIEYRLAQSQNSKCEQNLTDYEGNVTSPGYPENYPLKSDCFTLITVPENKIIHLSFEFLKLEFEENCSYDFCAIYDGPNEESNLLGRFCLSETPTTLQSTNNTVFIHFHSDDKLSDQGFALKYWTETKTDH